MKKLIQMEKLLNWFLSKELKILRLRFQKRKNTFGVGLLIITQTNTSNHFKKGIILSSQIIKIPPNNVNLTQRNMFKCLRRIILKYPQSMIDGLLEVVAKTFLL